MPEAPPSERWDEDVARELIGSLVLVGITYAFPDGTFSEQHQLFGYVVSADRQQGIELRLAGIYAGKKYRLPPDTRTFRPTPTGEYRLRSTGETVRGLEYTCAWTIQAPQQ